MANILPNKLTMVHDPIAAFEHLVKTAKTQLFMAAKLVMLPYTRDLAKAAIAFTAQVAIEYGYDVETIRAMERDLMQRMEEP